MRTISAKWRVSVAALLELLADPTRAFNPMVVVKHLRIREVSVEGLWRICAGSVEGLWRVCAGSVEGLLKNLDWEETCQRPRVREQGQI